MLKEVKFERIGGRSGRYTQSRKQTAATPAKARQRIVRRILLSRRCTGVHFVRAKSRQCPHAYHHDTPCARSLRLQFLQCARRSARPQAKDPAEAPRNPSSDAPPCFTAACTAPTSRARAHRAPRRRREPRIPRKRLEIHPAMRPLVSPLPAVPPQAGHVQQSASILCATRARVTHPRTRGWSDTAPACACLTWLIADWGRLGVLGRRVLLSPSSHEGHEPG